jgi:hypothetical protein
MLRPTRKLLNSLRSPQHGRRFVGTDQKQQHMSKELPKYNKPLGKVKKNLQPVFAALITPPAPARGRPELISERRVASPDETCSAKPCSRAKRPSGSPCRAPIPSADRSASRTGFVTFFQALAQAPQRGAQLRGVGPIAGSSFRGLTSALQRGKMICHVA